jgi:hypothetical protein
VIARTPKMSRLKRLAFIRFTFLSADSNWPLDAKRAAPVTVASSQKRDVCGNSVRQTTLTRDVTIPAGKLQTKKATFRRLYLSALQPAGTRAIRRVKGQPITGDAHTAKSHRRETVDISIPAYQDTRPAKSHRRERLCENGSWSSSRRDALNLAQDFSPGTRCG